MSTLAELKEEIGAVWCPRCKQETLPHDTKGTCLFCDTKIFDQEKAVYTTPSTATASTGRDALDRMDAGRPQMPAAPKPAAVEKPALSAAGDTYTRESIIKEIRDHIAEHGSAPSSALAPGNRLWRAARKLGLVYGDLVKDASGGTAASTPKQTTARKKTPTAKPRAPRPAPAPGGGFIESGRTGCRIRGRCRCSDRGSGAGRARPGGARRASALRRSRRGSLT